MTTPATRRFTVYEFERLIATGFFNHDERLELWDGEIRVMAPIGDLHAGTTNTLTEVFVSRFIGRATISIQNPIKLDDRSRPQPDVAVLRYRADRYKFGTPAPADVLLVIEVADSTVESDRTFKGLRYAQAGISEFWLMDVNQPGFEVYRDPSPDGYKTTLIATPGDTIALVALQDSEMRVADLLG